MNQTTVVLPEYNAQMSYNAALDPLVKSLDRKKCVVKFRKKETGAIRFCTCTRNLKFLYVDKQPPVSINGQITVWDLEKNDWRSFRRENVELWAEIKG